MSDEEIHARLRKFLIVGLVEHGVIGGLIYSFPRINFKTTYLNTFKYSCLKFNQTFYSVVSHYLCLFKIQYAWV